MVKKLKTLLKRLLASIKKNRLYRVRKAYAKRLLASHADNKRLTREQKDEIQSFYKKMIGKKIDLDTHRYFYSRTGVFSKEYVPFYLYHIDLIGKANKMSYRDALADKNMCDVLFPGAKRPRTILKNINGYFYMDGEPVSKEEAVRRCQNLQNMLIKPSLELQGSGVAALEVKDGITSIGGKTIEQVFDQYDRNYLIQERVKQHERMSALNPTSVNTLRVLTYRSEMEILVMYTVVRIGKAGSVIDNQSAGGISTSVDEQGRLGKIAYGGFSTDNILETDTGIKLEGYQVPSYDKVIETVKRLHYNLPFFDLVGWDMAVDEAGDPVLIEWNANTGLSQSAYGPGFGKYTERVFKELWPRPNQTNEYW